MAFSTPDHAGVAGNALLLYLNCMDPSWELRVTGQVALAMLLGGCIGMEREVLHKPAGFRTHMLVSGAAALLVGLGHALVLDFGQHTGLRLQSDPIRIVEAIVTGVSFLGAGTIFRAKGRHVEGLTTAASLLLCAALGVSVAVERFVLAASVTALTLLVLRGARFIERRLARKNEAPPPD